MAKPTLLKWYGGKSYLAPRIIEHFPQDYEGLRYVEPFGGGAAVLLAKNPSKSETYNDLDGDLCNFFRVVRSAPVDLQLALTLTPYAEDEWGATTVPIPFTPRVPSGNDHRTPTPQEQQVELARRFLVRHAQSFGGAGTGFSYSVRQSRRGMAQVVSGWLTSIDERLPAVVERLREVQVLNRRASEVIERFDGPDALFYCDPPYLPEARVATYAYGPFEMSEEDHVALLSQLLGVRGRVVLSGYRSTLYDSVLSDWRRVDFDTPLQSSCGNTRPRRIESLWLNY